MIAISGMMLTLNWEFLSLQVYSVFILLSCLTKLLSSSDISLSNYLTEYT
uniref:Uncharacterized protein n=1 Tax=Octopus bimaculoides TaxID=37653 RepID=A0A0L8I7L8_OCTBM